MLDDIAAALSNVIRVIVDKAAAVGLETVPTSQIEYRWWEGTRSKGGELRKETFAESSLRSLFERIGNDAAEAEIAALAETVSRYDDAQGWSPQFLMSQWKLLGEYFDTLDGQIAFDENAVRVTVERYESATTSRPYSLLTTLLWRGLSAAQQFAIAENVLFRPISPSDYKVIGRESPFVAMRGEPLIPWKSDWICEIREGVAGQGHGVPHEITQRIVSAIALAVAGNAEAHLVSTVFENDFLKTGLLSSHGWVATSRSGTEIQLSEADIGRAREMYALLQRIDVRDDLAYLRVPMRRLRSSAARSSNEDMLIDFVVGLESLLAPDSSNLEVTFRFRLRGAAILRPQTFGPAEDRLAFMASLYRARSRVVHGQTVENIRELTTQAENALKEIFIWFATHRNAGHGGQEIVEEVDRIMITAVHHAG